MSELAIDTNIKSAVTAAKKKAVVNPIGATKVFVPTIYVWEDRKNGEIIGAFEWQGSTYGLSFDYEMDRSQRERDKKQLKIRLRDTLDLLIHHGRRVMDSRGNINPNAVMQVEADRYFADPFWKERVKAFRRVCRIKEITKDEAIKLNLLK